MTRSFSEYAAEQKAAWPDTARQVYDSAYAAFEFEMGERERIGKMLRQAREERQLKQSQLAQIADIQQSEVSRIERGVSNPTETTIIRLARALGVRLTLEAAPA